MTHSHVPAPAMTERTAAKTRNPLRARGVGPGSVVLAVFLAAAYFVPRGPTWNADTRIFLTASIVDRNSLNIDPFATYTGDLAEYNGHYYADKAPGLSLLAVPVYAIVKYTVLGGKPYSDLFTVPQAARMDFLPRYVLALVFAALPTGILAALLFAMLARLGVPNGWRSLIALTYGLGTFAFPFATELFGHQLAALFVFAAFFVLYRVRHGEISAVATLGAGALAGLAILTEYPTALLVAALALYALARHDGRGRQLLWLASGMAPFLAIGAVYNTLCFGGPLSQGYAHLAGSQSFRLGQAQGFMGVTYPHLDALLQTTFGPFRGAFLLSPALLLALPGFVYLWRRKDWRAEWMVWLGSVAVYFLFTASYFEWDGGFSFGPRQFLPALPFLMLPIGELARRERAVAWRVITGALAAISIAIVVLAAATGPLFDPAYASPLIQYVLPSLLGVIPDPAHPSAAWEALAGKGPGAITGVLSASLDNNWGMLVHLPGILQLAPLAAACALVLGTPIWRQRRRASDLTATAWAAEAALSLTQRPSQADADSGAENVADDLSGGMPLAPVPGSVTVRQAAGALGGMDPDGDASEYLTGPSTPAWETAILAKVRARGDLPGGGVLRGLGAVKSMLRMSQELQVFKHIRTILLYGPLALGDDPLLEVNVLIICNPIKGPFGVERAFAEIDSLSRSVQDQTGVRMRPLIVVRGMPERDVPGEPSWRDLARRGIVVHGVGV